MNLFKFFYEFIHRPGTCNGIALWTEYSFSNSYDANSISTGPTSQVEINKFINWNMHTRQGVRLFTKPINVPENSNVRLKIVMEYTNGCFNLNFEQK